MKFSPFSWVVDKKRLAKQAAYFAVFLLIGMRFMTMDAISQDQAGALKQRAASMRAIYPMFDRYGSGGCNLHKACNVDADCATPCGRGSNGFGNNELRCKELTFTYRDAQVTPFVTKRCEAMHCPSPFDRFMLNGNSGRSPEQIKQILEAGGAAMRIQFTYPSPAVLPWDPCSTACIEQERAGNRCTIDRATCRGTGR